MIFTQKIEVAELLQTIEKLPTKAVDRILFYFSGQGKQSKQGQSLILSNNKALSLTDLRDSFQTLNTRQIAFILDTSFGNPKQGTKKRGGRTDSASLAQTNKKNYLEPLRTEIGWQVLCAAPHDGVTGERNGHGIMTGLMLKSFAREKSEISLNTLQLLIAERFSRLTQSQFGQDYELILKYRGIRKDFALIKPKETKEQSK